MQKKTGIFLIAVFLVCLVIALLPENAVLGINTANLRAYWAALQLFWSGKNPYSQAELVTLVKTLNVDSNVENIWHLPVIFVFPLIASVGSYVHFLRLELFLTIIPFLLCCFLILDGSYIQNTAKENKTTHFVLLFFLATFTPAVQAIPLSPNCNISLLFFMLFLILERVNNSKMQFLSGYCLAFTCIKPSTLFLVYLHMLFKSLSSKNLYPLLGFACNLSILLALPFLFSPSIYDQYFELTKSPPIDWMNPNLGTWLQIATGNVDFKLRIFVCIGAAVIYLLAQVVKLKKEKSYFSFELLAAISLLTTPYVWHYDFVFLLPLACMTIFNLEGIGSGKIRLAALCLLNLIPLVSDSAIFSHFYIWYPLGVLLVYLLSFPRIARASA